MSFLRLLAFAALIVGVSDCLAVDAWQELKGCRFVPNEWNDGDSFHIEHKGQEYIVRLYLVDCPESEDSFPDRVAEQAGHFGTSPARMIEIGRYAKQSSAQMLSRPFTVITRFQNAMGRSKLPRYYAFIRMADGDDLGGELLRNGLARSHGSPVRSPDGRDMRAIYDRLEDRARKDRYGAWGGAGPIRREPPVFQESEKREQPRQSNPGSPGGLLPEIDVLSGVVESLNNTDPILMERSKSIIATDETSSDKISLNNATKAELMELPGVGDVLATRIIEARPYSAVSELKGVKGIGDARYSTIAELVVP